MRGLVENLDEERHQSLHHGQYNDCNIKEGHIECSVQGRTGFTESRTGKE